MYPFLEVIEHLAIFPVLVIAFLAYLNVNKLWKRKHVLEVAQSVSVISFILSFISIGAILGYFIIHSGWLGAIANLILLVEIVFTILIAIGLWVPELQGKSIFYLLKTSLYAEITEKSVLISNLIHPANADKIIHILARVALIDNDLDEKEKELVDTFAKNWNIKLNWEKLLESTQKVDQTRNFMDVRALVIKYLQTFPPTEQVAQLEDLINLLVKADGRLEAEEEMMVDELSGLLRNYMARKAKNDPLNIIIAPQNAEQEEAIQNLFPQLKQTKSEDGKIFLMGPFYSEKYANLICKKYRTLNVFASVSY